MPNTIIENDPRIWKMLLNKEMIESLEKDAKTRGLKPKFVTHYNITNTGVQYLRLVSG